MPRSPHRPGDLTTAVLLAALLTWCAGSAAFELDLGPIGDLTSNLLKLTEDISEEQEIEIGAGLASGLLGAAPLVNDPGLQRYVNDVGSWVASHSERQNLPWTFGVIDSDGINAFAAPGGYILVTLGLYQLLENEAQLAGVLGHEIAHVVERHHLNALEDNLKAEILGDIAVLAAASESAEKAARANQLVNAGVQIYASGLDQELEFDADLRGVVLAARAGYDPFALLEVLATIDSIDPEESALAVLLSTHPPTAERLEILAASMDGKLDAYASGRVNRKRFNGVTASP